MNQSGGDVEGSVSAPYNISIDRSAVRELLRPFISIYSSEILLRKNKSFKRNIESDVESELSNILDTKDVSVLRRVFESLIKKQQQEQNKEKGSLESIGERQGRQVSFASQNDDGRCQTTFQTNIQPECETIVETVCNNVTVTRTRPDIKETCKTRVT